eukprot:6206930-Pleurochrysis_carterae.AAC.5
MKAELQLAHEQLLDCATFYDAPLSQRLIHCILDPPKVEGEVLSSRSLSKRAATPTAFLNLLKKGDIESVLAKDKGQPPPHFSPLFKKSVGAVGKGEGEGEAATAGEDGVTRNIDFGEDEFNDLKSEAGVHSEEEERGR